jgi:hypothetical protein
VNYFFFSYPVCSLHFEQAGTHLSRSRERETAATMSSFHLHSRAARTAHEKGARPKSAPTRRPQSANAAMKHLTHFHLQPHSTTQQKQQQQQQQQQQQRRHLDSPHQQHGQKMAREGVSPTRNHVNLLAQLSPPTSTTSATRNRPRPASANAILRSGHSSVRRALAPQTDTQRDLLDRINSQLVNLSVPSPHRSPGAYRRPKM